MVEQAPQSELRAAIEAEKQRIAVEPYYTTVINKAQKGQGMGFWAGSILGLSIGALGGLAVTGLVATGWVPALAFLAPYAGLPLVLGVSGLGGVMGGTIGPRAGAAAGAVSGGMAEFERRMRGEKLETEILQSPELQKQVIARYREQPVVENDDTIEQIYRTSKNPVDAAFKVVRPLTGLLTMVIGAIGGAIMFAGGVALLGGTAPIAFLGAELTTVGAAALGAALGGVVGGSFGIYVPGLLPSVMMGMGNLLSGKVVEKAIGKQPEPEMAPLSAEKKPVEAQGCCPSKPCKHVNAVSYKERVDGAERAAAIG